MRFRFRAASCAAAAVLAVLALAACSSGGGSSNASGSGGSSSSDWVIGSIGSYSGAFASSLGPTEQTINAWADWINATGGIDGHQVKLINMDDALNPAKSNADVRQLVDTDHVIAIVADDSDLTSVWGSYVESKGIPVIGTPFDAIFTTNADLFPSGTTLQSIQFASMAEAKKSGDDNFSIFYCAEAATCANSVVMLKGLAPKAGETVSYTPQISASQTSYAAQCLGAKQAGVNAIEVGEASVTVLNVFASCAQQGYHPLPVGNGGTVTAAWAKDPNLNGAVTVQPNFPVFNLTTPAEKDFQAALQKYAPAVLSSPDFGENEAETWAAGMLFVAAAQAAHLGNNPTPAQVVQGLYDLHGDTLGGLAPPLTFTRGDHSVNCWFTMDISGGQFTTPDGQGTTCEPGVPASQ
jgi:branched-chain amino acid transport system substrate-binding protein